MVLFLLWYTNYNIAGVNDRMKHYLKRVTGFIVITGLIASSLVMPVLAQQSGGIGGRPANPDPDNPRTQSIFIHTLEAGSSVDDSVLVSNRTGEERTIEIYAVDGVVTNTGAYTCEQRSESRDGVGRWISLAESEVTLQYGEERIVDFTLQMPEIADIGEHNGCIVFESKRDLDEQSGGIRINTRQALRVVATIPGDLKREVNISSFAV